MPQCEQCACVCEYIERAEARVWAEADQGDDSLYGQGYQAGREAELARQKSTRYWYQIGYHDGIKAGRQDRQQTPDNGTQTPTNTK